jgi:glycosyltransferase involved in cell wall biosynthesis
MHILLLTAELPFPPDSGPQVKTYHMLQHLTQAHRVTLVSFCTHPNAAAVATLQALGAEVHTIPARTATTRSLTARLFVMPPTVPFQADPKALHQMHALLAELVQKAAECGDPFDLVHADQIAMAPFAAALDLPRMLDLHQLPWTDSEGQAAEQSGLAHWLLRREIHALKRATARIAAAFDAVTVVNEDDRRALSAVLTRECELTVIPIAVDPKREGPVARAADAQGILSLSALWRNTNAEGVRWFTREVYPLVRRQAPQSSLTICGAEPPPAIVALAENDPTVQITGHIDDPRPFMYTAGCLIVPLRNGGGMRVTILEALARGIPVVSTSLGCAELDLQPGEHLLVADTPSEFADAVGLLLREPELGQRIAEAGRRQVIERYAWNIVCPTIDSTYARMTQRTNRHANGVLASAGSCI